jgi:hypothetical protein
VCDSMMIEPSSQIHCKMVSTEGYMTKIATVRDQPIRGEVADGSCGFGVGCGELALVGDSASSPALSTCIL